MKNFILITFIGILALGCSKDDGNELSKITGNWKLIEAKLYGFQGESSIDYSSENIIYNFQANGTLIVSGGANAGYSVGEYQYFFGKDYLNGIPEGNPILLVKINNSKWTYKLTNGKMTLGQSYVDGPNLKFERQ